MQIQRQLRPYQAASAAQAGAMGRVNTGMNETAVAGIQNYQNPYETQVVQASLNDVANQAAMSEPAKRSS